MNRLLALLFTLHLGVDTRLRARSAVAVIAIVGIVVAAIKAYVESQAGNIK